MNEVIKVEDCVPNIGDYDIPIYNAIIIPNNATNGDMVKAMFPNMIIKHESEDTLHLDYPTVNSDPLFFVQVSKDWWNAPYKKGGKE